MTLNKINYIKNSIYCILLLLLSSCTSMTNTPLRESELKDAISRNLILVENNDFGGLSSSLIENEIIFLGEYEHHNDSLSDAAAKFAVDLASKRPVVYACESSYSYGPFMEAASLGNPKAFNPRALPKPIQKFNSQTNTKMKILTTAIDIEHSIIQGKKSIIYFLRDLTSRSNSDTAMQIIKKEVEQITAQNTYDKMNSYLKKLKKVFNQYLDTFTVEDQDEITFYFNLLNISNHFYEYTTSKGIKGFLLNSYGWEIREKYFIKTVERAYRKANERDSILLCRVGAPHAHLTNKNFEAYYFSNKYSQTKGKVASIGLVPLYYNSQNTNNTTQDNTIDSIVKTLMKDYEYSYLSLDELQKNTNNSFKWNDYFSNHGPKHDAIIFIKVQENPG